ncbi:MAG TPA: Cof-type HAD-IIB family hydrolase [Pyrinomonadaceae bacterium]|nr:Cof-type HAD-IIB family hydrolase [Pyrinomonadaceae bacterium]
MAISLLALDLDGTLLNRRGQISDRNRTAIENARAAGVHVALVTGRRFRDSRPIALELGLDVPVISHNGALTKHAETLQTVSVLPLPLAAAREALRVGREAGADPLLSDDYEGLGTLVYDRISGENTAVHKYIDWARRIHGEEEGQRSVLQVESLEAYLDHEPIHLAFSGSFARMDQLEELLHAELGATVKILGTKYPEQDFTLIDIVNPAASKGAGVAATAAELGVSPDEIMAIGDNYNDLEMLLFAGTGVVMANAPLSLREIAGLHPTASNSEDGVALAIEQFILNNSEETTWQIERR